MKFIEEGQTRRSHRGGQAREGAGQPASDERRQRPPKATRAAAPELRDARGASRSVTRIVAIVAIWELSAMRRVSECTRPWFLPHASDRAVHEAAACHQGGDTTNRQRWSLTEHSSW